MAVNDNALESTYKQLLEQEIIAYLAEVKQLELRKAMDLYYKSKLAEQIDEGLYGIQYLDAKYLALDLLDVYKRQDCGRCSRTAHNFLRRGGF